MKTNKPSNNNPNSRKPTPYSETTPPSSRKPTPYGEMVPTSFSWVPPDAQREKAEELENVGDAPDNPHSK